MRKRNFINSIVPCGSCTLCCQGDIVILHKEMGDRFSDYKVRRIGRAWVLQHQENGDCIYLDREKGCTIHHNRPAVCREFDCRGLARKADGLEPTTVIDLCKYVSDDVLQRGRELDGRA